MAQPYSYRPNMNRAVTRKWAEARKVDYENDGWGDDDDDYDDQPQHVTQDRRSFTNPAPLNTSHRLSFDRGLGGEHRNFSAGPYPSSQGLPSMQPNNRFYADPAQSLAQQAPPSTSSNNQFPPRRQSLGQEDSTIDPNQPPPASDLQPDEQPSQKPLPFRRPADIYKWHAEEGRRRSEESARSSVDSARKDDGTPKQSIDEPVRKRQPTLDTVAERKSEYLDHAVAQPTDSQTPSHPDHTSGAAHLGHISSIRSSSSRYTDNPDAISVSSGFPSRNVSLHDSYQPVSNLPSRNVSVNEQGLPQISRTSTFDADMFASGDKPPPVPAKDGADLQHKPSLGYRTMVQDAFDSQNRRPASPATTTTSVVRSNTTSTSEISPIVAKVPDWDQDLPSIAEKAKAEADAEDYVPPRRLGTNRKDSPSPARRPLSVEAPPVQEPLSAVTIPDGSPPPDHTQKDQAPKVDSRTSIGRNDSAQHEQPHLPSGMSDHSDPGVQRTASEEWENWSAAKQAAHARHGIQDSNPTTPGIDSSENSTPVPFESLDRSMHMPSTSHESQKPRGLAGLPSQRPQPQRDESFRPILPGGWQSSQSIQRQAVEPTAPKPHFVDSALRTESNDSIPIAIAPQSADWKSEYTTSPQAQAFAAAQSAGAALAGIFSGPALTQSTPDGSEVSSIHDGGPTGSRKDPSLIHRDFGVGAATPPAVPDNTANRDFAADQTPKAPQAQFPKPASLDTKVSDVNRSGTEPKDTDSPTKDSERWWSEDEDEPRAPAPLRTNRLSTIDPTRLSPVPHRPDSDGPDADQLHSDIVKSLTPKSSNIDESPLKSAPRLPPSEDRDRPTSPPFAAAALAVSPGRGYQTAAEQNDWKPLSALSSQSRSSLQGDGSIRSQEATASTPIEKIASSASGPHVALSGSPNEAPISRHTPEPDVTDNASTATSGPLQKSFGGVPTPLVTSTNIKSREEPPSATREFAIFSEVPDLAPFTTNQAGKSDHPKSLSARPATPSQDATTVHDAVTQDRNPTPPMKEMSKPMSSDLHRSHPSTPDLNAPVSPITPKSVRVDTTSRSFPSAKVPFDQISSMGSADQRIKAYNDNREVYSQPVGQLENWLAYMNTTGHTDVFAAKPIETTPYVPSPQHAHKSSASTPLGVKQMQEDGKKLMASASKYGAKAGVLGKGLFSKGKEKFRTVSASQKGSSIRSKDTVLDSDHSSPNPSTAAPHLSTPTMATPVEDLSTYFTARDAPRVAAAPPFSPISEVSSQIPATERTESRIDPSPNFGNNTPMPVSQQQVVSEVGMQRADTVKSAGVVSAVDTDEGLNFAHLLDTSQDHRRNSSVSDVSSVTEPDRRQSLPTNRSTRVISPSNDHPDPEQHPHHAPSYSAAMATPATKDIEAAQDHQEESTLPAYQAPRPRITSGADIVPIRRIRNDEAIVPEPPRPFSFAEGDTILGHGTNQSLDRAVADQASPSSREQAESPLPSARRAPEELARKPQTAEDFARLRQQPNPIRAEPEPEFRIPGPYGQQLRSPRQKAASPILPGRLTGGISPTIMRQGNDANDTIGAPAAPSGNAFAAVEAVRRQQESQYKQHQVYPDDPSPITREQSDAFEDHGHHPHPQMSQDRGRRPSKLSSLFGRSRSKSQSRRLQKDPHRSSVPQERPESARRGSILKFGSQSKEPLTSKDDKLGETFDERSHGLDRPGTGNRSLSKDLFRATTVGSGGYNHSNLSTPQKSASQAIPGKKKRFSGLFGRPPAKEPTGPARASTMPPDSQATDNRYPLGHSQTFHEQSTIPEQYRQQLPVNSFQRETMLAENQHPALRQPTGVHEYYGQPQTSAPGREYLNQPDEMFGPDQQSLYSNNSFRQPVGMYQHENRPYQYQYENDMAKTPQRPDLPRLDTGDRTSSPFVPTSAPAVPASYQPGRQAISPHPQSSTYYTPPTTRANKDISYGSDRRTISPAPGPSDQTRITARVAALHTRSRSPKLGRRSNEDLTAAYDALARTPRADLGTFSSKKVSPVGGIPRSMEEQEKPWTLNLPGEQAEEPQSADPNSATSTKAREFKRMMLEKNPSNPRPQQEVKPQTVAEKYMGVAAKPPNVQDGMSPSIADPRTITSNTLSKADTATLSAIPPSATESRSSKPDIMAPTTDEAAIKSRAVAETPPPRSTPSPLPSTSKPKPMDSKAAEVYEMPGSRPEGYESEEEPVMSATAYPGQEWQPVFDMTED